MWDMFAIAMLVCLAVLVVPGALALRALRFSWLESVVAAPLVSMALFTVFANVYAKLGVFCTWWALFIPVLVVGVAVLAVARARQKRRGHVDGASADGGSSAVDSGLAGLATPSLFARCATSWPCLALYVLMGLAVMCWLYVGNADNAESFVQYYDNLHHMNYIESFLLTGNWSSFGENIYPDGTGTNPLGYENGFYPSTWHAVAALLASALGCGTAIAENASVMAFLAIVLPASMFLLMRGLFADKPSAVFFGALCTVGFAFFPWRLITFGPVYPNVVSLALFPAAAWAFIELLDSEAVRSRRISAGILFALGLLGIAFTQPNTVFTLGVFLAPFIVVKVAGLADHLPVGASMPARWAARVGLGVLCAAVIAVVWYACFTLPALQGVVTYQHEAIAHVRQAVGNVVFVRYLYHAEQPVMAIAIVVGALYCIVRRRKGLRIVAAYALISVCYVASASCSGMLQQLFAGFWYNDYNRLAALVCLFAIPLASLGMSAVSDGVVALARKLRALARGENRACGEEGAHGAGAARRGLAPAGAHRAGTALRACAIAVPCALFLAFSFVDFTSNVALYGDPGNAFVDAGRWLDDAFGSTEESFYTPEEQEFVEEAAEIVPEGAVIVNVPGDGSAFAYSTGAACVLYRLYDVVNPDELASSVLLRTQLVNAATSEEVRNAAEELGVEYVLLLDADPSDYSGIYELGFSPDAWVGLLSITDETPGFECVLSEDDMRLYRISALDTAA